MAPSPLYFNGLQVLRQVGKKFPRRHHPCSTQYPWLSCNQEYVGFGSRGVQQHATRYLVSGPLVNSSFPYLSCTSSLATQGPKGYMLNGKRTNPCSSTVANPCWNHRSFHHSKKHGEDYQDDYRSKGIRGNHHSIGSHDSHPSTIVPMDKRLLFQYLQLKDFTVKEMNEVFDKIVHCPSQEVNVDVDEKTVFPVESLSQDGISREQLTSFLLERLVQIDTLQQECYAKTLSQQQQNDHPNVEHDDKDIRSFVHDLDLNDMDDPDKKWKEMKLYAKRESEAAMALLQTIGTGSGDKEKDMCGIISRDEFQARLKVLATEIDIARTIPISVSMLLVGSSVGIIIPVMPYLVSNLGLSAGEFGMVVSSFAFSKLLANIPAAILVERHGRKPYLVYSLVIICCGVGGTGFASQFEHLVLCRSLTGVGVSLLRTAATLSIADCSTPLNRARTMATMMSSFAAGMSLGPAVGGILADKIGLHSTFYLVGGIYLAVASINNLLLTETKIVPEKERVFPWHPPQNHAGRKKRRSRTEGNGGRSNESVLNSIQSAVLQWRPLLQNDKVRNVVLMNGFYWFALSGAQMTLLPLILTDPSGLALSPTSVGEIYMGMSMVQVFGNPTVAKYIDKIGKVPGIVAGCSILSAAMFTLPLCTEIEQVAYTLGFWALGSTMLSTAPTAYISDHVQDDQRAQAIALLRTAGDIGLLVGASSTGALADMFNKDIAVHSSASLLLFATGWFAARRFTDWHQSKHLFK